MVTAALSRVGHGVADRGTYVAELQVASTLHDRTGQLAGSDEGTSLAWLDRRLRTRAQRWRRRTHRHASRPGPWSRCAEWRLPVDARRRLSSSRRSRIGHSCFPTVCRARTGPHPKSDPADNARRRRACDPVRTRSSQPRIHAAHLQELTGFRDETRCLDVWTGARQPREYGTRRRWFGTRGTLVVSVHPTGPEHGPIWCRPRGGSSVGQSRGLIILGSWVRAPPALRGRPMRGQPSPAMRYSSPCCTSCSRPCWVVVRPDVVT